MSLLCRARNLQNVKLIPLIQCCSSQQTIVPRLREYSTIDESKEVVHKFTISFEEYRKLKKSMKMRTRLAGLPMAFVGMGISSAIHVTLNPLMFEMTPEEIKPILGIDPIMFAALCGVGSGVVGYLIGGATFTATWKLIAKSKFKELQQRDDDFLGRLQKHRFSGINKYDDDYYGDKINSLSDYRQWIRQQQKRKENFQAQTSSEAAQDSQKDSSVP